jgi:hypothetical protein
VNRRTRSLILALTGAAIFACNTAHAQPGDRPGDRPDDRPAKPERAREEAPATPEELRERIERRLEIIRGEEARLQRALAQIEEGVAPEQIYDSLRERGRRGDGGPDGEPSDRPRGPRGPRPEGAPIDNPGDADTGPPERFDPSMAPRIMRLLEERNPEMHRRLSEARDRNPDRFHALLEERWPRIRAMLRAQRAEDAGRPDQADAMRATDREVRDLARRVAGAATDEDRAARTADLRAALERQFDLHAEHARAEITTLQERLGALIERLDRTTANRAAMIDERIADLTRPAPVPPAELPAPLDENP